jgi:hypothetical protein
VQGCWGKDGKELFYLSLDGNMMSVPLKPGPAPEAGIPRVLFPTRVPVQPNLDQFAVTGDGQRFLVLESNRVRSQAIHHHAELAGGGEARPHARPRTTSSREEKAAVPTRNTNLTAYGLCKEIHSSSSRPRPLSRTKQARKNLCKSHNTHSFQLENTSLIAAQSNN